jgi:hypothetical protein
MKKFLIIMLVLLITLAIIIPAAALPINPTSMNARFMKWQENSHVIHIFVWDDDGRFGIPAMVDEGQPIIFGFEWGGESIEQLKADFIDSDHDIMLSVDGGIPFSVKDWYQTPFYSGTELGPAWSWDHDGDGPGDGDGDGIGDWSGAVLFFRYQHPGLSTGTHEFVFSTDGIVDPITVEVLP